MSVLSLRLLAAVAALVSAAVHLYLWFDGVRHQHMIGPMFLVNVAAGIVIAVLLLTWHHWVPLFLVTGFGASTLGAFVIASTVGLYGIHTHWSGFAVWAAAVAEVVAVVTGLLAAYDEGWFRSARQAEDRSALRVPHLH